MQATGLAAFRGERLVFRDLDFTVAAGGALLLTGPNGSGKSTLLRLLAGLLRPAAGTLTWDGADALADLSAHARRVAYLGHQDAVKPALTAVENLRFAARLSGGAAGTALAAVGLQDLADLPTRMLSAGQRRRLALARLALSQSPLWLLDEPTIGLDTASVQRFGTDMMVTDSYGKPCGPWTLKRAIGEARGKVDGLPDTFSYHDLRHYFASMLIASGADVKTIQARLRHASAMTTLDTYGHLFKDADESTRAAIASVIASRPADEIAR